MTSVYIKILLPSSWSLPQFPNRTHLSYLFIILPYEKITNICWVLTKYVNKLSQDIIPAPPPNTYSTIEEFSEMHDTKKLLLSQGHT